MSETLIGLGKMLEFQEQTAYISPENWRKVQLCISCETGVTVQRGPFIISDFFSLKRSEQNGLELVLRDLVLLHELRLPQSIKSAYERLGYSPSDYLTSKSGRDYVYPCEAALALRNIDLMESNCRVLIDDTNKGGADRQLIEGLYYLRTFQLSDKDPSENIPELCSAYKRLEESISDRQLLPTLQLVVDANFARLDRKPQEACA